MNWLKRMPASVPLPPSPTKSLGRSDNESASSTESLALSVSNEFNEPSSTKALKFLRDKPSTVSLQHKADLASFPTTPASIPEREASRWPFRSPSVCTTTPAASTNEVADHFSHPLPIYEEDKMNLCERQQACEERVGKMRAYLRNEVHEAIARTAHNPFTTIEKAESSRRRIDSGTHDHGDIEEFHELQKLGIASASKSVKHRPNMLIPFDEDFLNWTMFRMRNHNMPEFTCIGCTNTHKSSLYQGNVTVWLLHGCKHIVYDSCFEKLHRIEPVYEDHSCHNCETFKRELKRHSIEEMALRYERLLEKTCAQYHYCEMDRRKMTNKIRMG